MLRRPRGRRWVYRISWDRRRGLWLLRGREWTYEFERKADALREGRLAASHRWRAYQELGQVVVHGKDGRIKFEHTYGRDPRRTKG